MKYICTLFVALAVLAVSAVNAQNASKLNSQSYTYVMKDINGSEVEIIDQFNFGVGKVTSQELGRKGMAEGRVIEKNSGAVSDFEITFKSSNAGSYVYKGRAEGPNIDGTITITDANGKQSTMAFRGMLTEEWNTAVDRNRGVNVDEESQKRMKEQQSKQ